MKDWDEKALLQELRREQRDREMWQRFAGRLARKANYRKARAKERKILAKIKQRGFSVMATGHNDRFDAWIGGARVEVKYSHWKQKAQGGCYQAQIRNQVADVVIFDAINGTDHFFIIPMPAVANRRTVEVCSYDVTAYKGQWADYLEAWELLAGAVEAAPSLPVQLELFLDSDSGIAKIEERVSKNG